MTEPLIDHAQGNVEAELTDEALRAQTLWKGRVAELLLMAPPEQRQNVMAEMVRRRYPLSERTIRTTEGGWQESRYGPSHGTTVQVVTDILIEQGWFITEGSPS